MSINCRLGDHYDGDKVDIWGLGCILYILLYGSNPFMQINDNETLCRWVSSFSCLFQSLNYFLDTSTEFLTVTLPHQRGQIFHRQPLIWLKHYLKRIHIQDLPWFRSCPINGSLTSFPIPKIITIIIIRIIPKVDHHLHTIVVIQGHLE